MRPHRSYNWSCCFRGRACVRVQSDISLIVWTRGLHRSAAINNHPGCSRRLHRILNMVDQTLFPRCLYTKEKKQYGYVRLPTDVKGTWAHRFLHTGNDPCCMSVKTFNQFHLSPVMVIWWIFSLDKSYDYGYRHWVVFVRVLTSKPILCIGFQTSTLKNY